MPNWTYNTVRMENIGNENLYDAEGNFDFNKLIPMPEGLNTTISGGNVMDCVAYYLLKTNTKTKFWEQMYKYHVDTYADLKRTDTKAELETKLLNRIHPETLMMYNDEMWDNSPSQHTPMEVGEYYLNLKKKCGYWNWYGWSNHYWGTKWNACNTYKDDNDYVNFDTAWCEPEPIWIALSKKFPDRLVTISAEYEEGFIRESEYRNGCCTFEEERRIEYDEEEEA